MPNEVKTKIIIDCFIRNNGHYRKMSEELTAKYGRGYSIGTISIYINSPYVDMCATKEELDLIRKIKIANSNNLGDDINKSDNPYYEASKKEKIKLIIQLYLNKMTMEAIAQQLQISKSTVSMVLDSYLKESRILFQKYEDEIEKMKITNKQDNVGNLTSVKDKKVIIELYLQGKTMQQIATMLDVSTSTISRVLKNIENDPILFKEYGDALENMKKSNKESTMNNNRRK